MIHTSGRGCALAVKVEQRRIKVGRSSADTAGIVGLLGNIVSFVGLALPRRTVTELCIHRWTC